MSKVDCYRIELCILDFERYGFRDLLSMLEAIDPYLVIVTKAEYKPINDWEDSHPLNNVNTPIQYFLDFMKDAEPIQLNGY